MLSIYRFDEKSGQLNPQSRIRPGVWINAVNPTPEERQQLQDKANLSEAFLLYGLDPDEGARYEFDEDNDSHLFIFDMPTVTRDARKKVVYKTGPLAIIITNIAVITINEEPIPLLSLFSEGKISNFNPEHQSRSVIQILYQISISYLTYLRDLNKAREAIESKLQHNLRNEELYGLMGIQRSLVYFMMSLRTDRNVLEQLKRTNPLNLNEDDQDSLEDTLIENQQAVEMAQISNSIINETADTYSSIINNNMNGVMKVLTSYSILLTIPTLVFSFYGMNVHLPLADMKVSWTITIAISIALAVVLAFQFWRNKYF
ncbi:MULTISPECIES: magnesium transporter CorA family protein [Lacticaseibacillus]|uniref:Magnesium and cobalt transporter protein n=2 Tax=Lacticaseibacillus TaxID=2759736 RepID=A0AAD1ESJ0_LACCA|nr:magnesium transporter CorA family protein [Lacticaseibacillus casei]MBI6596771.1 magnesium transporter CorA family protein [Lacticaseibacillus casei]MBO1480542.1 magnesium transporter CorA family protein [Lacticaseibacillus casei]MBO2415828.1 magnesium transporter CorA family protein [Lacticaseibacillus casei]MCK2080194.1 magnesium transporter CorA family protein [Lacticaseibacillus casei]MDZ5496445.1 magnesium transporter CorA family protein [Lacticaseibacillus casei]